MSEHERWQKTVKLFQANDQNVSVKEYPELVTSGKMAWFS